jgi:hypothetical protein
MMGEALQLARELLAAIRELTAELRNHRRDREGV